MEETSLGDFVEEADSGADPDGDTEGGGDAGATGVRADEGGGADRDSSAAVEPARPTSVWTPDGGRCERCGDRARRRWRTGGALVCGGCADW